MARGTAEPGQGPVRQPRRRSIAEANRERRHVAAALLRLGQLEGSAGSVAGLGQATGCIENLGEPIERCGRFGRSLETARYLGAPSQARLVARPELEGAIVCRERLRHLAHPNEDPADRRMRQCAVGRDRGGLDVGIDRLLEPAAQGRDVTASKSILVGFVQRYRRRLALRLALTHRAPRRAAPSGDGADSPTAPR